jgi:hypothetical protein
MPEKTKEQIRAGWLAKQSAGNCQEMLNAQTEDGKYQTLGELLSKERGQLRKAPRQ